MGKKLKTPSKLNPWFEARKRYRLTDVQVQMARELGLNPKKCGKYASNKNQPWKSSLGEFIEDMDWTRGL